MRIWISLLIVACSPHESRLDPVLRADQPVPELNRQPEPQPDERDRELERKLREVSTRPVGSGEKAVTLAEALGTKPGPFGPLTVLKPTMNRADVLAALPNAQQDGAMVWAATGIEDVAVEIFFDELGRLGEIVYYVPLAARPTIVTAWGAPDLITNAWLEPERRWRARLGEDAIAGKIELGVVAYTPFAELVGRGPDGLAVARPLIGRSPDEITKDGAIALAGEIEGSAHAVMPAATDVCGNATHLMLHLDRTGKVASLELLQCFDEEESRRRAVLATLEKTWGKATPTRTKDDRLVYGWLLPARRVEAEPTRTGHDGVSVWRIAITPR